MIYYFDLLSVFVCAITGAMASMRKDIDGFGVFVISAVAGLGGGTVRDITLGRYPVFWIMENNYLIPIVLGSLTAIIFANTLKKAIFPKLLVIFDAFGLGLFTVIGANAALEFKHSAIVVIIMGLITGVVGGMLRDILCNDIPYVLQREVYALASISGALLYVNLQNSFLSNDISIVLSVVVVVIIRLLAVYFNISLLHLSHFKDE